MPFACAVRGKRHWMASPPSEAVELQWSDSYKAKKALKDKQDRENAKRWGSLCAGGAVVVAINPMGPSPPVLGCSVLFWASPCN